MKNTATGKVVFAPTDGDLTSDSIGAFMDYVVVGDGSVEVDVSNLTSLPTGSETLTLFATTDALTLSKFSVTGGSCYYLQQNAVGAGTDPGALKLCYYAAEYNGTKYTTIAAAIDAAVEGGAALSSITVADTDAAVPAGYMISEGMIVAAAAERLDADMNVRAKYLTVQAAIDAAETYPIVKVYQSASVTSAKTQLYVMTANDSVDFEIDYTNAGFAYRAPVAVPGFEGVYIYASAPCETTFTWNTEVSVGNWNAPANWTSTKPVEVWPNNALYDVVLDTEADITVGNFTVGSVSVGAPVTLYSSSANASVTLTAEEGIVLTSASASLTLKHLGSSHNESVDLSSEPYTELSGKYVNKDTSDPSETVYTVANATAVVYDALDNELGGYATLAEAVAAAVDGQKVVLFADSNETGVALGGKSITFVEDTGATFSGSFTGNGTLVLTALLKSPASSRWTESWTGTVELPVVGGNDMNFNNYGRTGSTVKVNGIISGWLSMTEIGSPKNYSQHKPTLDIVGEMKITGLSEYNYIFDKVTGTGSMSFSGANTPYTLVVTTLEVPSGTTGVALTNNTGRAMTIGTLVLAARPTDGAKVLSVGGSGTVSAPTTVKVGNETVDISLVLADGKDGRGFYANAVSTTTTVSDETVTVLTPAEGVTSLNVTGISGKVAIPGTVEQITGVTAANLLLKVVYNATTDYYSGILSLDGSGNVSLDGSAAVGGVSVMPETADSTPMVVASTGAPTFAVKTIPGLWYVVHEGTSPDSFNAVGTAVQATSATTNVAGAAPGAGVNVKYYRLAVGVSEAEANTTPAE